MKRILITILAVIAAGTSVFAQEEENKPQLSGSFKISSANFWRGGQSSYTPALMPELDFTWGGFTAYLWACQSTGQDYSEVDFGLRYDFNCGVSVEFADYFFPYCKHGGSGLPSTDESFRLFNFDTHTTGHLYDVMLRWEPENIPVHAMWSTIIGGGDKNEIENEDGSITTKQAYSSYLEVGGFYEFKKAGKVDLTLGASLFRSDALYGNEKFAVVNVDLGYSKVFDLGKVSLPIGLDYILSPAAEHSGLVFSIGVEF